MGLGISFAHTIA